jgi:hypothetical protein
MRIVGKTRPRAEFGMRNRKKEDGLFSQSSGLKGTRKYSIAQAQGVRSARGRTASAGKHPHSGAVAWIPQGTCPRPPWRKPTRGSNRSDPSMFRSEPMKEPLPHDVLPRAGCTPWARAIPSPQRTRGQLENTPKPPTRLGEGLESEKIPDSEFHGLFRRLWTFFSPEGISTP